MPTPESATDRRACYRKLKKYKYQLKLDYRIQTDAVPSEIVHMSYLNLASTGKLTINKGYAWDGPSGPTIDTLTFMRASLVHDALYQLMRLGQLDFRTDRKYADDLLRRMCREDGMFGFRAWYVHRALRWFGEKNARPNEAKPIAIICAPD